MHRRLVLQATTFFFQQQLKQAIGVVIGGTGLFAAVSVYEGNEKFYRQFVMPSIRFLDPETTHNLAVFMAKYRLTPKQKMPDPPCLVNQITFK